MVPLAWSLLALGNNLKIFVEVHQSRSHSKSISCGTCDFQDGIFKKVFVYICIKLRTPIAEPFQPKGDILNDCCRGLLDNITRKKPYRYVKQSFKVSYIFLQKTCIPASQFLPQAHNLTKSLQRFSRQLYMPNIEALDHTVLKKNLFFSHPEFCIEVSFFNNRALCKETLQVLSNLADQEMLIKASFDVRKHARTRDGHQTIRKTHHEPFVIR